MATCLSDLDLDRLHAGEMDSAEAEQAREHMATCRDCARRDAAILGQRDRPLHRVRALGPTVNLDGERPAGDASGKPPSSDTAGCCVRVGDCVGSYKLLELLGEGGFGVVFLAEQQEPIRRRVALKILKPGMDSRRVIARFKAEEQALALMDHPNVAHVFDAGTTEPSAGSLPYFVMEYVAGVPITNYCDRHMLSTEQRLELFMLVCDAVQHAHHKGIIHRDLKPSNVLVTVQDGQAVPKVIDFGVAKAISQRLTEQTIFTEQGQLIGTPEYMSPEQAEMSGLNIDTRTDIYSLGVLLYELLVGALPFDPKSLRQAGYSEIQRIIREQEPPKPSMRLSSLGGQSITVARQRRTDLVTLTGQLRGDLDWITIKAMEKDRTRRYSSASEMAADIRRHLSNEPVSASPPRAGYRLRKFVRRHRLGVAAAAAVSLALVLGIVGTTTMAVVAAHRRNAEHEQRRLAEQARQEAERQARIAKAINEFLQDMLAAPNPFETESPTTVARDVKVADVLDSASARIGNRLGGQADVEAAVCMTLGNTYLGLGHLEKAERHLRRAWELRRQAGGEEAPDTLESAAKLGESLMARGLYSSAEPLFRQVYEVRQRSLTDNAPQTLKALHDLAVVLDSQKRPQEAEALYRQAVEGLRQRLGDANLATLIAKSDFGTFYMDQGRCDKAQPLLADALQATRRYLPDNHPYRLTAMNNMAVLYSYQERFAEARVLRTEELELSRRVLGDEHPETLHSIANMADLNRDEGRFDQAEPLYVAALSGQRRVLGADHPDTLRSMNALATLYYNLERTEEAVRLYREILDHQRRRSGPLHPDVAPCLNNLAAALSDQRRFAEAESLYREALDIRRRWLGDDHADTVFAEANLASVLVSSGKYGDALSLWETIIGKQPPLPPDDRWMLDVYRARYGRTLFKLSRYDEAEAQLLQSHTALAAGSGPRHAHTLSVVKYLVDLYDTWGKPEKAAQWRARLTASDHARAAPSQPASDEEKPPTNDNPTRD